MCYRLLIAAWLVFARAGILCAQSDGAVRSLPAEEDLVVGVELGGVAKAYPMSLVSSRKVIRDEVGNEEIVVLWDQTGNKANVFLAAMESERIPPRLRLEFNPQLEGAPFMDKETFTHWMGDGRAVEGPLRGNKLRLLSSGQVTWMAWKSAHRESEVYSAVDSKREDPTREPVAKLIAGERVDWDSLVKTFGRVIRVEPSLRQIVLQADSETQERVVPWTAQTEFYWHGGWGEGTNFVMGQRIYLMAYADTNKQWTAAHTVSDEMSLQGMSRPYVLKHFDKELSRVVLTDELGRKAPVEANVDQRSILVSSTSEPLVAGQACYYNSRIKGEERVVMELLDGPSFQSERALRFERQLEAVATNGLGGTILSMQTESNRLTLMIRRADAWIGRTLQVGDKGRLQLVGRADAPRRLTVMEVHPDYARLRVVVEVPANNLSQFQPGDEIRVLAKTPKILDPMVPVDLGRFTTRQERTDYFLSSTYCTCGMMGTACAGHWNTLAACKIHGCGLPDLVTGLIHEWIAGGKTDAQILELLRQRHGELVLKQHRLE